MNKAKNLFIHTDGADKMEINVEGYQRNWKQSEEEFQYAGDRVNVTTLVGKWLCTITVC